MSRLTQEDVQYEVQRRVPEARPSCRAPEMRPDVLTWVNNQINQGLATGYTREDIENELLKAKDKQGEPIYTADDLPFLLMNWAYDYAENYFNENEFSIDNAVALLDFLVNSMKFTEEEARAAMNIGADRAGVR